MEQIKIDVVKQWLINKKEFSPLEVIENLEKEKEKLREYTKFLQDIYCGIDREIAEIKKENEELKKDKEYLDNINNEQTEIILQLNEKIEKMKNCFNCKFDKNGIGKCSNCDNFENWELAE